MTYLALFTTTDLTFEHTVYELFDDFNEYIVKLKSSNTLAIKTCCILANDIDDAQERCENILLRMFHLNQLA